MGGGSFLDVRDSIGNGLICFLNRRCCVLTLINLERLQASGIQNPNLDPDT